MLKEILEKMIEEKRAQMAELEAKAEKSESVEEVRAIGETLKKLKDEIEEAEKALEDDENDDGQGEGSQGDGEGMRSFNPVAAYSMRTAENKKDAEKRAAEFVATGKMIIGSEETRAVLASSGSIAKPKSAGGINDHFNTVSSIVDMVGAEDLNGVGSHEVAYVKTGSVAGITADGSAVTSSDPVFRKALVAPYAVDTICYVSKNLKKLTPLRYEEKIKEEALKALRTKVGQLIISGTGNAQPFGIYNAKNTEESPENIFDTLDITAGAIDETTLRKIVFAYGGDENVGGNAVLFLNKSDLVAFGDVRGTNEKAAVYEIIPDGSNPNTGVIKDGGLVVPYCINSTCGALATASADTKCMCYGDPMNYCLGMFSNYEITVSEDFRFDTKQLAIMGEVMIGGNLTVDKGFVVVNAASAG